MTLRRGILLIAAFLLLLTRPGIAQENGKKEEDRKKAREEWEKLDPKTREERRKALRELLKGKSEAEKREILERIGRLDKKPKSERERLRDRHAKMLKDLEKRLRKALSTKEKTRYDNLAPEFRKDLLSFTWRRIWEVGQERFRASLTPEEKVELEGLRGRKYFEKIEQVTDRRIVVGMSLDQRRRFDALPEKERKGGLRKLRFKRYGESMRKVETEAVFPEIKTLLGKPRAEIEKVLEAGRRRSPWGGRGLSVPRRPHHKNDKRGREFCADRELHGLLHRLPRELVKQYDDEFNRIVTESRDPQSRKKALDEFKARLRKVLAD